MLGEDAEKLVDEILRKEVSHLEATSVHRGRSCYRPDLEYKSTEGPVVVEVKTATAPRIQEVLGALSHGTIVVRNMAEETGASPVVVVVTPRLGSRTAEAVEKFVEEHLPDIGWGVVDETGNARLVIPTLGIDVYRRVDRPPGFQRRSVRLFSDLNRWMLKILLLRDVPPEQWSGPREEIRHPTHLANVAGVSVTKAHTFYRAFEERGYLRRSRSSLHVVRRESLLASWIEEEKAHTRNRQHVRSIFSEPGQIGDFLRVDRYDKCAVMGFEACRLHGVLHTMVPDREICVRSAHQAMKAWDLEPVKPPEAHAVLVESRHPRSVFRGQVSRKQLPVVDILQAALDVAPRPGRGREQADYIIEHVLGWRMP